MATNGPFDATVATSTGWTNPSNALAIKGGFAVSPPGNTSYIVLKGFGFSVPTGSTITGVSIGNLAGVFAANVSTGAVYGLDINLTVDGSTPSPITHSTTGSPGQGGSNDTWGYTNLTVAQVNGANFGVMLHNDPACPGNTSLDYVGGVIVYYTTSSGGTGGTGGGGGGSSHTSIQEIQIYPRGFVVPM